MEIDEEDQDHDLQEAEVINYFGETDNANSVPLNFKSPLDRSCWPNQGSLCDVSIKRFEFAHQARGSSLRNYKRFDFQIYTANKLILESQTLHRMADTPGVLPAHIALQWKKSIEGKNFFKKIFFFCSTHLRIFWWICLFFEFSR